MTYQFAEVRSADGRVIVEAGPDGRGAVVRVGDIGVGIPAGDLPRLFDRFGRGRRGCPRPRRAS